MSKASLDNHDWAQLVQEIEQAKSAVEFKESDRVAAQPVSAQRPMANVASEAPSALNQHEFTEDYEELLGMEAVGVQDEPPMGSRGIRSHLAWGIGGFVIGAICWHLVGFWSFVGDVVFTEGQNTTVVQRNIETPSNARVMSYLKKRPTGAVAETDKNCSAFYKDPDTGRVHSTKCQAVVRALGSGAK